MKRTVFLFLLILLALFLALFASGCACNYLKSGDTTFFRATVGNRIELPGALQGSVTDTNGARRDINLQGYRSDQVEGIKEGAGAAGYGFGKSLKQ